MTSELSRRDLLRYGAGAAAFGAMGASVARADTFDQDLMAPPGTRVPPIDPAPGQLGRPAMGPMPGEPSAAERMGHMQEPLGAYRFPRYEPGRRYSPPPPLRGQQMGRVNTLGVPPLGHELDGEVKVFTLIAQPVWHELTDGDHSRLILPAMRPYMTDLAAMQYPDMPPRRILAWGYNGITPGPTIEATEGDRIRIVLKNELPEPTSIHWHGFEIPNHMDGASPETQKPVLPGETFEYEFTLYQSGTLMYHSGVNVAKQDIMGLSGLVVIHPLEPQGRAPDREFALLHQEWVLEPGNPHPNVMGMDFNWISFNGKVAPSIPPMHVKQGERVRIRQGNLSMQEHPIHLHGYTFNIVGTNGGPIPPGAQWPAVTVSVSPGQTRDIEFDAWNPGVWRIHCHKLHHVMMNGMAPMPIGLSPKGGMFTLLFVEPEDPDAPFRHPRAAEIEALKQRKQGQGR